MRRQTPTGSRLHDTESAAHARRRSPGRLGTELRVALATPEDTVLAKLEWARKSGGSERQLADVVGVLEIQGPRLDVAYIERWAQELGVLDLWREVSRGTGA